MAACADASGLALCPCLNASALAALTADISYAIVSGQNFSAFSADATYASHYGQNCGAHDFGVEPLCTPRWCEWAGSGGATPFWCGTRWCWVDANRCSGIPAPTQSFYFAHAAVALTYSYETCEATNTFDNVYEALIAPKPPPPPPPAAPPSQPPSYEQQIITASVGGGALLVLLLVVAISCLLRHRLLKYRAKEKSRARQQCRAAIETTQRINHPAAFVRAADFLKLGKLKSFEELRDLGLLVYRDAFDDLALGEDYTLFFSHQWTSYNAPDPSNAQYPVMCAAVHKIARLGRDEAACPSSPSGEVDAGDGSYQTSLHELLVWVDYCSIPQAAPESLKLAIQSLAAYSSLATTFVIVAPPVAHKNTGALCDFGTYRRRTWCRAEQLCHLFRNGLESMWLATSATSVERLHVGEPTVAAPAAAAGAAAPAASSGLDEMTEEQWLIESIHVFQGDITNEMDKLSLVMPVLGLYAELYACRGDESVAFAHKILQQVQQSRDEILPPTFRPAASLRTHSHAPRRYMKRAARAEVARRRAAGADSAAFSSPTIVQNDRQGNRFTFRDMSERSELQLGDSFNKSADAAPEAAPSAAALAASTPSDGTSTKHATGRVQIELFGNLVETLEHMIDEDKALQGQLLESVRTRRNARAEKIRSMLHRRKMSGMLKSAVVLRKLAEQEQAEATEENV